ncbi:unnamed protein product [Tilletia laevis]|uniref:Uncharacterized protein n=2 Tax=Tilletia TaxID=13289 RepID=A0A177U5Y5_9BASI|nr:hypothetical protein CF336_g6414 [Tilletia laevis]KAE8253931.1 hypothetical protein A4X03_0g5789 [Tilletia caries]KAE8192824.1 hypothetical protein CF335_g5742 [Tilletia laevis]CAD6884788.1 unnamed protein product [Tilletia caries]CAD6900036.1 unnamed protein product [Tilletia laevis]
MTNILGLYNVSSTPVEQTIASSGPCSTDELPALISCQPQSDDDDGLTPTQEFLRRPSLPKRTVSDFAGGEVSFASRRRRTLALGQAYRSRPVRRPSTANPTTEEESPRSPQSMVRSVSMPVATRTEYERQRQAQNDLSLSGPSPFAGPGFAAFSWTTTSVDAPGITSPTRRLSSCSPIDVIVDFQEGDEFPWTARSVDSTPGLSPSSSFSSGTTSSGPPSPSSIDSPFKITRCGSTSSSSSLSPYSGFVSLVTSSSRSRSTSSASSPSSPRKPFSPLTNKLNLNGDNAKMSMFSSFDSALPSRRTSFANFGDNKALPYPSPQRRRSLQGRTIDINLSYNKKMQNDVATGRLPKYSASNRRPSSPFDLSPHLEENENWATSPSRPSFQSDAEFLVAQLEPISISKANPAENQASYPTISIGHPAAAFVGSGEDEPELGLQDSNDDESEDDDNDDGIETPRAVRSPLLGCLPPKKPGPFKQHGPLLFPGSMALLAHQQKRATDSDFELPPPPPAHHIMDPADEDVFMTPFGERIAIHPGHLVLPRIPV